MNLIIGSSSGGEISSTKMPAGFFMNYSGTQAKEALKSIKSFDAVLKLRKENALKYMFLLVSILMLIVLKFVAIPLIIIIYVVLSMINNLKKA